jgi:hypothetical protein
VVMVLAHLNPVVLGVGYSWIILFIPWKWEENKEKKGVHNRRFSRPFLLVRFYSVFN